MPETQRYLSILTNLKPGTSRRNLLFIAAVVWTLAGGILLFKGTAMMMSDVVCWLARIIFSSLSGIIFYRLLFFKISTRHISRIIRLKPDRPCLFSFFNFRSYLLMFLMISMGVLLRTSEIIPVFYLSVLYLTMAIPLLVSAFRFYHSAIYYTVMVTRFGGKK